MSFFSKIKEAIFGKPAQAAPASSAIPMTEAAPAQPAPGPVYIEAVLNAIPGADNLNWRSSIVDLMKLVGIDASYENRMELAIELGDSNCAGSAEDNIMLHKAVMKALAENGGRVPADLLD